MVILDGQERPYSRVMPIVDPESYTVLAEHPDGGDRLSYELATIEEAKAKESWLGLSEQFFRFSKWSVCRLMSWLPLSRCCAGRA